MPADAPSDIASNTTRDAPTALHNRQDISDVLVHEHLRVVRSDKPIPRSIIDDGARESPKLTIEARQFWLLPKLFDMRDESTNMQEIRESDLRLPWPDRLNKRRRYEHSAWRAGWGSSYAGDAPIVRKRCSVSSLGRTPRCSARMRLHVSYWRRPPQIALP